MQLVGYEPTPSPALLLAAAGSVTRYPLEPGDKLDFSLGPRRCAGRIRDGQHIPCERDDTPWCEEHADTWVCARCRGSCLKDEMDCYVKHDVYLAAFAPDTFKVGVTTAGRLRERLTEQGADRGCRIRRVPDGRIARELEADIATEVSDRVAVREKINGLTATVDVAAWKSLLEGFDPDEMIVPTYDLGLDERPVPELLARGKILGVKGRILCLRWSGSTFASDLRTLVGHQVNTDGADRDIQVGLGTFA